MTLPINDTRSDLEESSDLHVDKYRCEIEELCHNGEKRCQIIDNDSDNYSFGDQCNINEGHDRNHAFGLDSLLYGMIPPSTCTEDEHDGSCAVCLVREVRDR